MSVITPHIPDGLIELMKTLAKSVLKEKSENIHEFAAEHFENLLIERDGSLDKGYEKSKSCEKCLMPKEKVFLEFVWSNRPKLCNESNFTSTSEKNFAENKFRPRKHSSKITSEILLSIKEEDEGTQKLSEKEKIAACIIQKAFKAYIERRQLQENGHAANESDDMTENTAPIIIQKALKKVLSDSKSVAKNNAVIKPEISLENNNEENIDKEIISQSLESYFVVDVLEENHKSQDENIKKEVVKELGEHTDISKAHEDNGIHITSNITIQKNNGEEFQQNENISRQDTLPMDETTEIYKDEIGNQEFGNTNDLVRKDDKNKIIMVRNDNSQHFATLLEEARNESELTKALWYIGEEPIITSSEETISSSHIEKETNLMNAKNVINSPESTLSKTLRESAVGTNHSLDAPFSMIYDSLEFNNNNQLADASIEADNLQNVSGIKKSLNFVSTDIKFIGGQVQGDSVGVELTSDTGNSSEARQNGNSASLDTKAEDKRMVVNSRNQEGNKMENGIIEEAKHIAENIISDTRSENEVEKSSEFSKAQSELYEESATVTSDSTKIEYDIEEIDDGSKKLINYEEGGESTIMDENVNEVSQKENANQVEAASENTQTTSEYISTLSEPTKTDVDSTQDRIVLENVDLEIVRYNETAQNINSQAEIEATSVKNVDNSFKSVDKDIEKEERLEIAEPANSSNQLNQLDIEEVVVTQYNSEIIIASSMQNKQKLETNASDLTTSDNGIKEEDNVSTSSDTSEQEIQDAEKNIIQPIKNANLILSAEAKTLSIQNSIEDNIMKKELSPLQRQASESSNDDKPAIRKKEMVGGVIGSDDKSKDLEGNNKKSDINAQDSNKIEENTLEALLEPEQSKLLVEKEIAGIQMDKSVRILTEGANKTIPSQEVIENESYELTANDAGQRLSEIKINKKVDENCESQEKEHFDENIKGDNIGYHITNIENRPFIEEYAGMVEGLTKVQEQMEIKEESEGNPTSNDHGMPSFNKQNSTNNIHGNKPVKNASDKNIKSSFENQTNIAKESTIVEENVENPKKITNFQEHKEINEEYEVKPSISYDIESYSDKQHTNDNVKLSSSMKSDSSDIINENNTESQVIAQKESLSVKQNLTNAQQQGQVIESNDNIKLADSKAENKKNNQYNIAQSIDNDKLNITQGEESEASDKLKEVIENLEEAATKDVPVSLEKIQSITEDKQEHNMAENTNNNTIHKSIDVYDVVDDKNQASTKNNSEFTEANDVHINKDNAKNGVTEYFDILPSDEIKESAIINMKSLEEQKMKNKTCLVSDDDKREKKCTNETEEKAAELPSVMVDDNDQQENESPIKKNFLDNIPITGLSKVRYGLVGKTAQENETEDRVQKKQSTNIMEGQAPVNTTTETEDGLKEAVKNKFLTNSNPPDILAELNNESNLNSSVANFKYESGDVEEVKVTKPRDYVNTILVATNKISTGDSKIQSDSFDPALQTSGSIEDKEQAAIQIQKMYERYKTRNDLKNKDVDSVEPEIVSDKNGSNSDENKDENVIDAIKGQQNIELDNTEQESALTIQKTFRGYRARRDLKRKIENATEIMNEIENEADINDMKQNVLSEVIKNQPDEEKAVKIIQKDYKTRKQTQSSLNLGSASYNENQAEITEQHKDEHTLSEGSAALIIQKNFKGYTTRKQFKITNSKEDSSNENNNNQNILTENAKADGEAAALVIQKTYRGYKSRNELKKRKEENLYNKLMQESTLIEELDEKNKRSCAQREQIRNEDFFSNENVINNVQMAAQSTNVDNNFSLKQIKQLEKLGDNTSDILNNNTKEEEDTIENKTQILARDVNNKSEQKIVETEPDKIEEKIILPLKDRPLNSAKDISSKDDENSEYIENKEGESSGNVSLDKKEEGALTIQKNYRSYIARKKLHQKKEGKSSAEEQNSEKHESAKQNKENIKDGGLIDKNEKRPVLILKKSYTLSKDISEEKNEGQDKQDFVNLEQKPEIDKKESEVKKIKSQEGNTKNSSSGIKEKAAVAIQKTYKGYKTRRDLKQIKEHATENQLFRISPEVLQLQEEYESVKSLRKISDLNSDGEICPDENTTQTRHQPEQEQKIICQTQSIIPNNPGNTDEISYETPNSDRQREEAVLTIQKKYRGWQERRTLKSKSNTESTKIEKDCESTKSEARIQKTDEEAALAIQRNYRRYITKRDISRETGQNSEDEDNTSLNKEKAAFTIQKYFRGYNTRQILKKGKSSLVSTSDEGMPDTEVDRNINIEQPEEDQENPNGSEEKQITKRFSAVSTTDLSDAETARAESRSTINDEMPDIENVDLLSYADNSLEGMYYSLRKNEINLDRMQKRASERKSSLTTRQSSGPIDITMYEPVQYVNEFQQARSLKTDDGFALNSVISDESQTTLNTKNQEFLENMHRSNSQSYEKIEGDNEKKAQKQESYEDDMENQEHHTQTRICPKVSGFEISTEANTKEFEECLDKLHGTLKNINQPTIDEDASTIRKKMLEYSVSEADSDHCEVAEEKINAIRDDFNISTALETVTSTYTDSTIISAASKIQAGARGFLTRRRLRRASVGAISTQSEKFASFGNDAIDESLENLIEENIAIKIQNSCRGLMQHKSHTTPSPSPTEETFSSKSKDSDDKNMGITDVKIEHKLHDSQDTAPAKCIFEADKNSGNSISENEKTNDLIRSASTEDESPIVVNLDELNLAARRMTLQRGDAVQKDSTPEDDADNVTSSGEHGKVEKSNTHTAIDKGKRRRAELTKLFGTRQRTMPVQIDSEILRVIPKHLRKRIRSAEAQKKEEK